ncbi:CinA family protein [Ornithinimicrobium cavernae]|uniref:CinA family protein n=1 Tax=Ornithinimicrobium cavernae TaxID=2666047 RepID=UPI001F261E4F|nr:CinA family protein [Ornithinimicrobium cavernae]
MTAPEPTPQHPRAPDPTELDAPEDGAVDPLAVRAITALKEAGASVATAESLTGGLVCAALTSVPGASAVVFGGVASYSTELKTSVLGVPRDVIEEHGTVAGETALLMADGVRRLTGADVGVATTGVAGPDPSEGKPVGTVFVAVTRESRRRVLAFTFYGSRDQIRRQTVEGALNLVLEMVSDDDARA